MNMIARLLTLSASALALGLVLPGLSLAQDRNSEYAHHDGNGNHSAGREHRQADRQHRNTSTSHARHDRQEHGGLSSSRRSSSYGYSSNYYSPYYGTGYGTGSSYSGGYYGAGYGSRYGASGYSNIYNGAYNCTSVNKVERDSYGRRVLMGGTKCYDAYGQSFIVPGSRYVIKYY